MRRALGPTLTLLALALAAGCGSDPADATCTVDRDCAQGSCVAGRCLTPKDAGARKDAEVAQNADARQGDDAESRPQDATIAPDARPAGGDAEPAPDAPPAASCGALDEREPNDTAEAPQMIAAPGTYAGELGAGTDEDWYAIEVAEGGTRMRAGVEVRGAMDAELYVVGPAETEYERVANDPTSTNVSRELFFPAPGTYVIGVHDARAAAGSPPRVTPGTFCYSLSLTALPAPAPMSITLPAAGMRSSASFTTGARGEIGYFRVTATPANDYRPFVLNLSAPPEGPGLVPDVDTILTVWDPVFGEVYAESDDAGNTNSNLALTFTATAAGRVYWLVLDHYALGDEDEDGLESALSLEIDEPVAVPAGAFTDNTRRLTEARSVQWYLSAEQPGRRLDVRADGAAGGLSNVVVFGQDVSGEDLGASAGGTSTAAIERVALVSDRSLFAVVSLDDLTAPAANGAYSITIGAPAACGAVAMTVAPSAGNLAINEVLWDPATDASGDANGDGESNSQDDEFVELINTSSDAVDLSGVSLSDLSGATSGLRFVFPCGTVLARGARVVVFGGGALVGPFGGSEAFAANVTLGCAAGRPPRSLCLNNAREEGVLVRLAGQPAESGVELGRLAFSSIQGVSTGPDASYVRCTSRAPGSAADCDRGTFYVQHDEIPGVTEPFSPGAPALGAPPAAGDTCEMPDEITMNGVLGGQSTVGLADDYAPEMACIEFETLGPDRVYHLTVPGSTRLTAIVTPDAMMDAAVYLLAGPAASCGAEPLACLAGADGGVEGEVETVEYRNMGASPVEVFLVVDDFADGGSFTLETRLQP